MMPMILVTTKRTGRDDARCYYEPKEIEWVIKRIEKDLMSIQDDPHGMVTVQWRPSPVPTRIPSPDAAIVTRLMEGANPLNSLGEKS